MKKLIAGAFAATMATSAMAATLDFNYGATWFLPRFSEVNANENFQGQGQSFALNYAIDNDTYLGVYTEALMMNNNYGTSYPWSIQALQVSKGIVKNVSLGVRLGTF